MIGIILLSLITFASSAGAYGVLNHEKVVDAGKDHLVVLKDDGSVWGWGDNSYYQLANTGADAADPNPIKKADGNRLSNIKEIAAGGYHTVALDESGKVWTWGRNDMEQLGHSSGVSKVEAPKVVELPRKIVAIAAGDHHTLAVDENGQVWAWGRNIYGQTGESGTVVSSSSNKVPVLSEIVAVTAGADHSLALKRDGTVWTWGRNSYGQLGNGETTDVNDTPRIVPGVSSIMEIAAGDNHTIALNQDRTTVYAWGLNSLGQLGDGGRDNKLTPIQVEGITDVTMIAAGDNHTIALKDDGTVWAWGRNTSGVGTSRPTPIQIKGLGNVSTIGGGGGFDSFVLAVRQDGTVWLWKSMSSDPTTKEPVFTQVHGIDNVMQINEFPFVQGGQVLLRYFGDENTVSVKVNGSFNDWVDLPLREVGNNVWELQVELEPGEYTYGFLVNGHWMTDPLNRNKVLDDFGNSLSILNVLPYPESGPIINGRNVTFTYSSFDDSGLLELDVQTDYVAVVGSFSNWREVPLVKQSNNVWAVTQTLEPGDYYYSFVVRDLSSSPYTVKHDDPLNPNLELHSVTGVTRNKFRVYESLPITVPVTGVTLNKGSVLDLVVGERESLYATVSPTNASNKNVNWTSSNRLIVDVDANGKLTAISKGTAVIVATTVDGGKTATLTVTVSEKDDAISYPRVGYKDFGTNTGVSPKKAWSITFSKELDRNSLTDDSVYILNETGGKMPIARLLQKNDKTLEIHLINGLSYESGSTYYLFIEDIVRTKTGEQLSDPVQMKFTIEL